MSKLAVISSLFLLLWALPGVAGDISGNVKIYEKGGKSLHDNFAHAVVSIKGITAKATPGSAIIDQKDKKFQPRVLPIVKGQEVDFYNRDKVKHNVWSLEKNKRFDLGRYPQGEFRSVVYETPGRYKVYCNIHQEMILDVVVMENQYFAVTQEDGSFQLKDVPEGQYTLNVWHIFGGEKDVPVTVAADPVNMGEITITSTQVIRDIEDHRDKDGKRYKKRRPGDDYDKL